MSDLLASLKQTLGVPSQFAAPLHPNWAPPRPEEQYRYQITISKTAVTTVEVVASSDTEAEELAQTLAAEQAPAAWAEYDTCVDEVAEVECANRDDLDAWDAQYEHRYDHHGQPKCYGCDDVFDDPAELIVDSENPEHWYCGNCSD